MSPMRRYLEALRRGHLASWASMGALLLLVTGGVVQWVRAQGRETTDDAFVEGTLSRLAPEVSGRVVEVLVRENEEVRQGQLLVRLDPADAQARIARARADLDAARNRMASAEASAASSEAEGRAARAALWHSSRELDRLRGLVERGVASAHELDSAQADYDAAVARVRAFSLRARAERATLADEAPIRQAQATLDEAGLALERTRLVAPFDAVVGRKNVHVGDIVRPGQALLALRRDEPSWVVANFKETQLRRMAPGSPAVVRIDAYPDSTWYGHVESFSPASGAQYALIPPEPAAGNFTKVVQRVPVKIVLDAWSNGDGVRRTAGASDGARLAIGLSAEVSVDVR